MQNRLALINRTLENCLTVGMARGLYYQAYFDLLEWVGEEVTGLLEIEPSSTSSCRFGTGLDPAEILYIADRVETYLKEKVFRGRPGQSK